MHQTFGGNYKMKRVYNIGNEKKRERTSQNDLTLRAKDVLQFMMNCDSLRKFQDIVKYFISEIKPALNFESLKTITFSSAPTTYYYLPENSNILHVIECKKIIINIFLPVATEVTHLSYEYDFCYF